MCLLMFLLILFLVFNLLHYRGHWPRFNGITLGIVQQDKPAKRFVYILLLDKDNINTSFEPKCSWTSTITKLKLQT